MGSPPSQFSHFPRPTAFVIWDTPITAGSPSGPFRAPARVLPRGASRFHLQSLYLAREVNYSPSRNLNRQMLATPPRHHHRLNNCHESIARYWQNLKTARFGE